MKNSFLLYRTHDADLIGLFYMVGTKEFGHILKESLRILVRDNYKPTHIPPTYITPYDGEKEQVFISMCISNKKDIDVDELLSHVKPRRMGSFCKMAMRFYIGRVSTLQAMLDVPLVPRLAISMSDDLLRNNAFGLYTGIYAGIGNIPTQPPQVIIPPTETILPSNVEQVISKPDETSQIPETTSTFTQIEPASPPLTEERYAKNTGLILDTDETNDDDDIFAMLEGMM